MRGDARIIEHNYIHIVLRRHVHPAIYIRSKKLLDQIKFAKNIYINYNPGDYTLGGAYIMSKRYQLGKQVRKPLSKKAVYINFETLVDKGHSNFLNLTGRNEIPEAAFQYYNTILHGDTAAVHDTHHYQPTTYRGIGYDLLP